MYKGLEARLHDLFWQAEAPEAELTMIVNHLRECEGRNFEIGCGSGRLLLPLNSLGYPTDGNDLSSEMLELLDQKESTTNYKTFCQPIREIDIAPYTNFLIPAFTLMLMTGDEVERTLQYIHQKTVLSSSLYFTIFMPWAEICGELEEGVYYDDHRFESADGGLATCRTKFSIDRTRQILKRNHKYTFQIQGGEVQSQESEQQLRWFSYREICLMLNYTGWKIDKVIFDLDPKASSEDAHQYTFIATKKENK